VFPCSPIAFPVPIALADCAFHNFSGKHYGPIQAGSVELQHKITRSIVAQEIHTLLGNTGPRVRFPPPQGWVTGLLAVTVKKDPVTETSVVACRRSICH
jgi:hypothetical protein